MKTIILLISALFLTTMDMERTDSLFQYELNSIDGKKISLSEFKGDVLLIVNTASECGFTPQYAELQELYETYSSEGFKILGFPANNFGGQEPGTDEEIAEFCEINYGVTFQMFSKISVAGEDKHPLFKYLTGTENPDFTGEIGWNFEKFLIDREGNLIRRFNTRASPAGSEIVEAVESAL